MALMAMTFSVLLSAGAGGSHLDFLTTMRAALCFCIVGVYEQDSRLATVLRFKLV